MLVVFDRNDRGYVEARGRMLGNGSIVRYNPRQMQECSRSAGELRVGLQMQRDGSVFTLRVGSVDERHGNRPISWI